MRFRELGRRVTELRQHLLPHRFSPTGTYSDRQYDRARSFRLLSHAEFEACMEERVIQVVEDVWNAWIADRRPRTTLMCLLAYHPESHGGLPDKLELASGRFDRPLRERIDAARKRFVHYARIENHGIREANVLALLLPAGVHEFEVPRTWLADIDSFGHLRGETAHQGLRTQQPLDPRNELTKVRDLIRGFAPVDARLEALRTE